MNFYPTTLFKHKINLSYDIIRMYACMYRYNYYTMYACVYVRRYVYIHSYVCICCMYACVQMYIIYVLPVCTYNIITITTHSNYNITETWPSDITVHSVGTHPTDMHHTITITHSRCLPVRINSMIIPSSI